MRTRTWLWALSATALPAALLACGDSSGSGGSGGTATTTSSTSTSSSKASSTSTSAGTGGKGADNCPGGNAIDLAPGALVTLQGSTKTATDDVKNFCAMGGDSVGAPDQVYKLHTTQDCTLTATLTEQGFDGLLSLRSICDSRTMGQYTCENAATAGETIKGDLPPGDHWLVVDGATAGAKGDYKLDLLCADPMCGDGVINLAEEQCDTTSPSCGQPGTGQTACKILSTAAADNCTSAGLNAIPLTLGAPALLLPTPPAPPFNNTAALDDQINPVASATCPFVPATGANQSAPDQVFEFLANQSGKLDITMGLAANGTSSACDISASDPGCWNSGLFVREGTCAAGTQIGCGVSNPAKANGVFTVSVNVTAGTHYFVFVKSPDAVDVGPNLSVGSFYLKVSLSP